MHPTLIHFLATLATDTQLMERFIKDPSGVMHSFGLSDQDVALVLGKHVKGIEGAVQGNATPPAGSSTIVYYPVFYPAYATTYIPIPLPMPSPCSYPFPTHYPAGLVPPPPPMNHVTHFTVPGGYFLSTPGYLPVPLCAPGTCGSVPPPPPHPVTHHVTPTPPSPHPVTHYVTPTPPPPHPVTHQTPTPTSPQPVTHQTPTPTSPQPVTHHVPTPDTSETPSSTPKAPKNPPSH